MYFMLQCVSKMLVGPDSSLRTVVAQKIRVTAGSDVCHRGCAYIMVLTVQMSVQCYPWYSISSVHYKEPLKLFDKGRA